MSTSRKYAELLDIDTEPDVYETTPDLTEDNSTQLTAETLRTNSTPPESENDDIDRHRINPDEARSHFLPSGEGNRIHSTRISGKRKGYRSSKGRQGQDGRESDGDSFSDSEGEKESLERKLARLQREIVEVKAEFERQKAEGESERSTKGPDEAEINSAEALSAVLESIAQSAAGNRNATSRLSRRLASASQAPVPVVLKADISQSAPSDDSYEASAHDPDHTLSKVTSFDTRLTLLESALGLDALPLPTQDPSTTKAVLPTLDNLDRQLTTLNTATDTSLDTISRRIRQLTQDAQNLETSRKAAAKAAREATANPKEAQDPNNVSNTDEEATIAKINALYGTLPTIESLAPLLPATLDRLRSLRALHADAAVASQGLTRVEERQEAVREEIKAWREGLETVEAAVAKGEGRIKDNAEVVEGWVRDLEKRLAGIGR